jgi:ubiquitin-conjugating enzyme E2 S
MTSIHAPISPELKQAVMEAKRRGEDPGTTVFLEETDDCSIPRSSTASRNVSTTSTVIMKRTPSGITNQGDSPTAVEKLDIRIKPPSFLKTSFNSAYQQQPESDSEEGDDEENEFLASKENNPSLSPSPVIPPPPSPHRHDHSVLGKRPLSVLSVPSEPELVLVDTHDDDDEEYIGQTASERNIASNFLHHRGGQQPYADVALEMGEASSSHHRKSAKLSDSRRSVNTSGRGRTYGDAIFSSTAASKDQCDMNHSLKGKENVLASKMSSADGSYAAALDPRAAPTNINASPGKATSTSRSVSASLGPPASTNASTARKAPSSSLKPKSKPRIGVRRL